MNKKCLAFEYTGNNRKIFENMITNETRCLKLETRRKAQKGRNARNPKGQNDTERE